MTLPTEGDVHFAQAQAIYDLLCESNPHLPLKDQVLYVDGLTVRMMNENTHFIELNVLITIPDDFWAQRDEIMARIAGTTG